MARYKLKLYSEKKGQNCEISTCNCEEKSSN